MRSILQKPHYTLLLICSMTGQLPVKANTPSLESAQRIIETEMNQRAQVERSQVQAIKSTPALKTHERSLGNHKIIFRQTEPQYRAPFQNVPARLDKSDSVVAFNNVEDLKPQLVIQLSAIVYDHQYSELIWRQGAHSYTIWTNLDFNYLRPIGSFETDEYHVSYIGMTESIDSTKEIEQVKIAETHNSHYFTRWKKPPVPFNSIEPEYLVVAEKASSIPEELYTEMDALIGYYIANKETLQNDYQRSQILNAARKEYQEQNPTPPSDIYINYWKVESREKPSKKSP